MADRRVVYAHANGLRQILGLWDDQTPLPSVLQSVDFIDHIGDVHLSVVNDTYVLYAERPTVPAGATLEAPCTNR